MVFIAYLRKIFPLPIQSLPVESRCLSHDGNGNSQWGESNVLERDGGVKKLYLLRFFHWAAEKEG